MMFNWLKNYFQKPRWYEVYKSSEDLSEDEKQFLDNYTEDEFCGLLTEEYMLAHCKITVKQAVQWVIEEGK